MARSYLKGVTMVYNPTDDESPVTELLLLRLKEYNEAVESGASLDELKKLYRNIDLISSLGKQEKCIDLLKTVLENSLMGKVKDKDINSKAKFIYNTVFINGKQTQKLINIEEIEKCLKKG